jgi:cAMP phosphodiesterase
LEGLKIFVTHIKEELIPHPTGKTARERIILELEALEKEGQLGVEFFAVKRGDRICELVGQIPARLADNQ